jgi:hypothetical protein
MGPRAADIVLPDGRSNLSRNIAGYYSATEMQNAVISPLFADIGLQPNVAQWARAPRIGYPAG